MNHVSIRCFIAYVTPVTVNIVHITYVFRTNPHMKGASFAVDTDEYIYEYTNT